MIIIFNRMLTCSVVMNVEQASPEDVLVTFAVDIGLLKEASLLVGRCPRTGGLHHLTHLALGAVLLLRFGERWFQHDEREQNESDD